MSAQYDYYQIVFSGQTMSFNEWFGSRELRDFLYGVMVGSVDQPSLEINREGERLLGRYLNADELGSVATLRDEMWRRCTPCDDYDALCELYSDIGYDDIDPQVEPLVNISSLEQGLIALNNDDTFSDNQGYHLSQGHIGLRRTIVDLLHAAAIDELLQYMDSFIAIPNLEALNRLKSHGWIHTEIPDHDGHFFYASIQTSKGELVYV